MRNIAIAVLDSFSEKPFSGNPAAVCLLESPLQTTEMQAIAMEMNLSETAFVEKTKEEGSFSRRWFTPTLEIDLCGHATLAAAHRMYTAGWVKEGNGIRFQTLSGKIPGELQGPAMQKMKKEKRVHDAGPSQCHTAKLALQWPA